MHASLLVGLAALAASPQSFETMDLGLDLSPEGRVKTVVVAPPLYKGQGAPTGFAGVATKLVDKLDFAVNKKLTVALGIKLGADKVVAADKVQVAISKEGIKAASLRTASGLAQLAQATQASWVVYCETNKSGLTASIYDGAGKASGKSVTLAGVQVGAISAAQLDKVVTELAAQLVELSKPSKEELQAQAPPPPSDVGPDIAGEVESEIALERARRAEAQAVEARTRPRAVLAVGAGTSWGSQRPLGDSAQGLASLEGGASAGLALYAQVSPLAFVPSLADKAWSDVFVDLNYRRSLSRIQGVSAGLEGTSCPVTDDDFQLRANFRYRLGEGYLPRVGLGVGWAQERQTVGCALPVASGTYRGVDLQLRALQPIWQQKVGLDFAIGPRFLVPGPQATASVGFAVEAWVEARPVRLVFLRGGGRLFRAAVADGNGLSSIAVRAFLGLEAGVAL